MGYIQFSKHTELKLSTWLNIHEISQVVMHHSKCTSCGQGWSWNLLSDLYSLATTSRTHNASDEKENRIDSYVNDRFTNIHDECKSVWIKDQCCSSW